MEDESGRVEEENGHDGKDNKIEETTLDKPKKEDEERVASNGFSYRTNRYKNWERQQEEKVEREETKKEIKKLKRIMEDREKKERKNNLVIRGLKGKGKKNLRDCSKILRERI